MSKKIKKKNIGTDVKELLGKKKSKRIIIIAIALLIAGPILSLSLAKMPVNVVTGKVVSGGSSSDVTLAYAYKFSLFQDQSCVIEYTARYNSTSLTLIIVGLGEYNTGMVAPGEDPDTLARRNFMLSTFTRSLTPVSSYEVVSNAICDGDDSYYIEFMGDGTSGGTDRIWSEPGQYVVIVYVSVGSDSGVFDLKIYLEGPGDFLNGIFTVVGLIMILGVAGVVGAILIKRFLEV